MTAKRLGEFLEKWKRNELEEFLIYEKDGKEYDVDKDGNLMAHCNLFGNTIMKAINDQEISHFIYFNSPSIFSRYFIHQTLIDSNHAVIVNKLHFIYYTLLNPISTHKQIHKQTNEQTHK